MGSRVHVREDEGGEEVIGLVTAVAHGWFTVELPGQTQVGTRADSAHQPSNPSLGMGRDTISHP